MAWICQYSDKSFSNKFNLGQHEKKHKEVDTVHPCDMCLKVLRDKRSLVKHKKFVHDGIQRNMIHNCEVCGKAFHSITHLKEHMQSKLAHPKAFTCNRDEKFVNQETRMSHIREVHEVHPTTRDLTCESCGIQIPLEVKFIETLCDICGYPVTDTRDYTSLNKKILYTWS